MSTNDVPGANPANNDKLAMGCWAEHQDGSLIFVESTEAGRVIYSVFDMSKTPPVEYRDAMPETSFKSTFSMTHKGDKWTWHDKTPFPWDRVIKKGASDGPRMASAEDTMNAAERVMESRERLGSARRARSQGGFYDDDPPHDARMADGYVPRTAAERVADSLHLEGEELNAAEHEHRMARMMSRMEGLWGRIADALERLPGGRDRRR